MFYFTPSFTWWGDNESFGTVGANGPTAPAPDDREMRFTKVRLQILSKYE